MLRRDTPPLLSSLLVIAAVSCAATPPAAAPDPAPVTPAPSAAPLAKTPENAPSSAQPGAPPAPPAAPLLALPPPMTEALPPLTRAFLSVPMPGVKGWLASISGRGPRDVWLLTSEEYPDSRMKMYIRKGIVIHHDGKRIIKRYEPDCMGAVFSALQISKDGVILSGSNPYIRAPPVETGLLNDKGAWECWNAYVTVRAASSSLPAWTLNCGYNDGRDCYLQAAGGKRAALPTTHASFGKQGSSTPLEIATWQMRGDDDGWMVLTDDAGRPRLYRYNGVGWVPKAALDGLDVAGLEVSDDGSVWILAAREKQSSVVLRFDGRALHPLPVPESFTPSRLVVGAREVWFFGRGRTVYQYDGQRLRQGEVGFEVADGWAAPNGEMWIVGGTGNPDDDSGKPMAVRTPPLAEGR